MTSKYRSGYEQCDKQEGSDATNSRTTSRNSKMNIHLGIRRQIPLPSETLPK